MSQLALEFSDKRRGPLERIGAKGSKVPFPRALSDLQLFLSLFRLIFFRQIDSDVTSSTRARCQFYLVDDVVVSALHDPVLCNGLTLGRDHFRVHHSPTENMTMRELVCVYGALDVTLQLVIRFRLAWSGTSRYY